MTGSFDDYSKASKSVHVLDLSDKYSCQML